MAYSIPVTGTGYYPNLTQNAINYFSIVQRRFNPFIIDASFRRKPMFLHMVMKDLAKPVAGGFNPINQPIYFDDWGAVVNEVQWTGSFTPSPTKMPAITAMWNQSMVFVSIDTMVTELAMMQGSGSQMAVIDSIKTRFTDFYFALLDYLDTRLLTAAQTPYQISGLQEAIDDGTTYATYGGLSRSDYPKWASVVYNNTDTTTPAWQLVAYYLAKYKQNIGGDYPNLILCSYGVFEAIVRSLTGTANAGGIDRIISATPDEVDLTRGIGVQLLNINGIYVMPLDKITDATVYFLHTSDFHFDVNPDFFFTMFGQESLLPVGLLGWRAGIAFAAQFYNTNPRQSFKVTNFQTVAL